jgi:hypothetical protein
MIKIKPKITHKVVIEFNIDVAPEFINQLEKTIASRMYNLLGYPLQVLSENFYSFDEPKLPEKITVTIKKEND